MTQSVHAARARTQKAATSRPRTDLRMTLILVIALFLGIALVSVRDNLLPARFFYDGNLIQATAQGKTRIQVGESYASVAAIYRGLGLQDNPLLVYYIGFTAGFVMMLFVVRAYRIPVTRRSFFLIGVSTFFTAVYLAEYSKDVFVLGLVAVVLLRTRSRWLDPAVVGVICIYAAVFRNYWFLTATCFVVFTLVLRVTSKVRWLLLTVVALIVVLGTAIAVQTGEPDHYRVLVNSGRELSQDANSMITRYVPGEGLVPGLANNLLAGLFLMLPVPLLLSASPYYLGITLLLVLIWAGFVSDVRSLSRRPVRDSVARRLTAFVLAFLVVQSMFEPDYGSALRHLTPLLPVLLAIYGERVARDHEPALSPLAPTRS
jgi:hypothetical protein